MTKKAVIRPVFLPHAGCPYRCVYCNQSVVTGVAGMGESPWELPHRVSRLLDGLFKDSAGTGTPGEIAFYGGTFTALGAEVIRGILDAALPWILRKCASGIRFSTRPDNLSCEICSLLSDYPITTVELGVQSLSDVVLRNCRRGYTAAAVEEAATRVHGYRWDLGVQLMAGLPGDSAGIFLESIEKSIRLGPSFVRIYPTLVLDGTLLAEWYRRGAYQPLGLDEAIRWCVPALEALNRAEIPVARMGLHEEAAFRESGIVLGGPHHPSFGQLVKAAWWRARVDEILGKCGQSREGRCLTITVPRRSISEVVGHAGENVRHWKEQMGFGTVRVTGKSDWVEDRLECSIADVELSRRRRRRRQGRFTDNLPH